MSLFINNGLSGLLAAQQALQTIANNVANANTEGYVRQEAILSSNRVEFKGGYGIGTGVHVADVERFYDQFLGEEIKTATMVQSRAQSYHDMAARLDGMLGNPDLNITTSIQRFFEQLEAVNRDPTSTVNREQLLAEGDALQSRFRQIDSQITGLSDEVDYRLQASVTTINDIAAGLADINNRITATGANVPNDLLDQRDRLLGQLAEQIDFTEVKQANGMTNVMIGSGQPLVLGVNTFEVALMPNEFDASKLELAYNNGSGLQSISSRISGGATAGLLGFRNDTLATVSRELGQIALGLTETFNARHRVGSDLEGQIGSNFFTTLSPLVTASARNSGTATVSLSYGDVSSVEASDYELMFDGTNWNLTNALSGGPVAMTGSGTPGDPFIADGMEFAISAGALTGDRYLLQPVSSTAGKFALQITDPTKVAVAALLSTSTVLSNTGNASVSDAEVSDPSAPGLLQPVQIVFSDPATFRIFDNGGADLSGPLAYTSGAAINFNGWTVHINGSPQATDVFTVKQTAAGSGDNTNGLSMATVSADGFFANGRLSVEGLGASMLTSVGSAAARSSQDLIVQNSLLGQAQLDFENISGVNLDEEAANLLRFQEAYMAASKVIGVANDLFQTLLNSVGR